jgi:hypothetical protein
VENVKFNMELVILAQQAVIASLAPVRIQFVLVFPKVVIAPLSPRRRNFRFVTQIFIARLVNVQPLSVLVLLVNLFTPEALLALLVNGVLERNAQMSELLKPMEIVPAL